MEVLTKEPIVKTLLFDRVFVRPTPKNTVTRSGIIIPDAALANMKPITGTIIQKGTGTAECPMDDVSIGDLILFTEDAGIDMDIKGELVKILPYKAIICVV